MKRNLTRSAAALGTAAAMLALAACGATSSTSDTGGSGGGTAASPAKITFWGWAPGYADAVKAFNASHPKIQVAYQQVTPGSKGGYDKMLNAVKAGSAPCLAQVGYETLPSFVAQGAVADITSYAKGAQSEFAPAAWSGVDVAGKVYGVPVDTGPQALFYRKDVFGKLGLKPPTTWAQFAKDGQIIHKANPHHYLTSGYVDYDYAGLAQQAGANWFSIAGDHWKVSIDSTANQKVASYWQGLVDKHLISPAPMWDQSWYTALGNGDIAAQIGAAWLVGLLKSSAKPGAQKWAVAPMPQWTAGAQKAGNSGGSSTAVLKGCSDPAAAYTFAHWMSTDPKTYTMLVNKAGLYPAATKLLKLPVLSKGDPYFGGEKVWSVFAKASQRVVPGWTWGPDMPATVTAFDDAINKAWAGKEKLTSALSTTQSKTVSALQQQGLTVKQ